MLGKILRIIAIILMGLASAMMILGGIGTICIAFWPEKYPSLAMMVQVKPIFQVAAITTIIAGLLGIWITIRLRHFTQRNYLYAILILLLSLTTAGVKMYFSNKLRGSVAPTNIRFDLSLIVLIYFLILRIPGLWDKVRHVQKPNDEGNTGAAVAAIIGGTLTLTVQYWAGPTHTFNGVNYADVWHTQLAIIGWTLVIGGIAFIAWRLTRKLPQPEDPQPALI
jgi:hypothetical protein